MFYRIGRIGNTISTDQTGNPSSVVSNKENNNVRTLLADSGNEIDVPCVTRQNFIAQNKTMDGPFLIEEEYTVLLIDHGWSARPYSGDDILCTRQGH